MVAHDSTTQLEKGSEVIHKPRKEKDSKSNSRCKNAKEVKSNANKKAYLPSKPDLKVVLLGGPAVGKTCLVKRYTERRHEETSCTIGANFVVKSWGNYLIAIWDTSGEEKYHSLGYFYCRNTNIAIIVYDITNRKTFELLRSRYFHLLETLPPTCLKIVVGDKLDLLKTKKREVSPEEGEEFARSINRNPFPRSTLPFFEASSLTGENVDALFEYGFEYFFPQKGAVPKDLLRDGIVFEESDVVILNPENMLVGSPVARQCCW